MGRKKIIETTLVLDKPKPTIVIQANWKGKTYTKEIEVPEIKKSYTPQAFALDLSAGGVTRKYKPLPHRTLERIYNDDEWVRATIDKIVASCTVGGYHFKPKKGTELNEEHQSLLERFFEEPNEEDCFIDILRSTILDLLIYGDAYNEKTFLNVDRQNIQELILEFNEKIKEGRNLTSLDIPYKIYYLPAKTIEIKSDGKTILEYQQKVHGSQVQVFSPLEIVQYKLPSPNGDIYGYAPTSTMANTIAADIYASLYNAKFFENNATPRLHINLEDVSPEGLKEFAARVEAELKGNPHKNLLTSGKVRVEPISLKNTDIEFSNFSEGLRTKIFAMFGMYPIVMGITGTATRESVQAQISLYKNITCRNIQNIVASRINRKIIRQLFPAIKMEFEFNALDILDEKDMMDVVERKLRNQMITINEWRSSVGLKPVPYGDKPIIPWSKAKEAILETEPEKEEE